jgi:hypothetical protein
MKGSDSFATAPVIPMGIVCEPTPSSEMSPGLEPGELYSGWGHTAWWRFVATEDTELSINLLKSTFDPNNLYARLMVWTGPALGELSYVAYSDGSDYLWETGMQDVPEVIMTVTAGTTYHVQASIRNGYGDMTYVLQVGKFTTVETDWLPGGTFERTATNPNFVQGVNWGYGKDPWVEPEYSLEPNLPGYQQAIEEGRKMQWTDPMNQGQVGPQTRVEGGWNSNKPNPDYNGINFPVLFDWSKYDGRGHSSAIGHRRLADVQVHYSYLATPPKTALSYSFETPRPKVLKKVIGFSFSGDSSNHDGEQPAQTTAKYQLLALTPPADDGSVSDSYAALFPQPLPGSTQGPVIYETGAATTSETFTVDMTPYMSAMGGTIVRGVISEGVWNPTITGNDFDYTYFLGSVNQTSVTYTMQNPRMKYTYRVVDGDGELPVITGRPDVVRRRFVRA